MFPVINGLRSIEFGTPGNLNAADFRASHIAFWTGVGATITDDTLVVTVYFDLLSDTPP